MFWYNTITNTDIVLLSDHYDSQFGTSCLCSLVVIQLSSLTQVMSLNKSSHMLTIFIAHSQAVLAVLMGMVLS